MEIKRLEGQVESLNEQMQEYTLKMAMDEINTNFDEDKHVVMESTNSNRELGLTSADLLEPLEDENALEEHYQNIIAQVQCQSKQEMAHLAEFYERKIRVLR